MHFSHFLFLLLPMWWMTPGNENPDTLETTLMTFERAATALPQQVSAERLSELNALAQWVADGPAEGRETTDLVFICTHNSRRSHMGQIWAQATAWHFGLDDVRTFSGGTEATAFNPRAVAALRDLGVRIAKRDDNGDNPVYDVRLQQGKPAAEAFSKRFTDPTNPQDGFAAVMTCSDADEACPVVFGAAARFATPYVDPKVSDGTPEEQDTYADRARQIGTEMAYVMSRAAALRR